MIMGVFSMALGQERQVTGTVTDVSGEPLPGVSVLVVGTTTGSITSFEGTYTLKLPEEAISLEFRSVGYKTQQITIGTKTKVDVTLEEDAEQLEEVVVTALGFTKSEKSIGYASTTVSGDDIALSQAVNPMSSLQGKVAGLQITGAADPGSSQNIMIRGANSFGNSQPLIVIDGVPLVNEQNNSGDNLNAYVDFGSGLNALNPDDIESQTILKGAAATALYGSRAANGAIIIVTKSGKNSGGKMRVTYNGNVSVSSIGRIPSRQNEFGQGWSGLHALDENGNWGPRYDGQLRPWGNVVDGQQQVAPFAFQESRYNDYFDLGINYKNAISASGGNENTNYFVSFSQTSQDGIFPEDVDTYKRSTISARGSHKVDRFTVSSSVNFSTEKTRSVPTGQGASAYNSIFEIAENLSIVDLKDYNSKFNNLDNYFTPYGINPYYSLFENGAEQEKHKLFGKVEMSYNLRDNLSVKYRFGGDVESSTEEYWTAKIKFTPGAPNEGSSAETDGNYRMVTKSRYEVNHDAFLNFNPTISDDFTLSAIVGTNINDRFYTRLTGEVQALDVDGFYNLGNGLADALASQYQRRRRLIGAFATVDMSYKNYLFLNVVARNDWSSTLPKENNSFFYPGATLGFVFTDFLEEKNVMGTDFLNFGKLRVAYGMTGNDAAPYQVNPAFVTGNVYMPGYSNVDNLTLPLGGVNSYMVSNQLGSLDLQPELTKELEFGIDLRFFNERFNIDASYYDRTTEGMIAVLPLDPTTGYTSQIANLADVNNKGIELMLDMTPIKTNDLSLNFVYTFTKNESEVLEVPTSEVFLSGFGGAGIYAVPGMPMGVFKTSRARTVMLDAEGREVSEGGTLHTVVDGNGNVLPTTEEEFTNKDVNEDFAMGLKSTLTYKGFSIGATLDWRHGGHMYSRTKDYMHWTGSAVESTYNDRNPFIVPNSVVDNGNGTYSENTTPVTANTFHNFYNDYGAFESSEYAIIDRSFLKLREVVLSYNVPSKVVQKYGMQALRLGFNVGNILLWTPADNPYIDPEATSFGSNVGARFGEFMSNPPRESYTFSLSATF